MDPGLLVDASPSRLLTQFTSEIVAIPLALGLIGLALASLPRAERRRVRQSVVLLLLSIGCGLGRLVLPEEAAAHRALLFGATFFLLASIGRTTVLLVVYFALERRSERTTPRIFRDL